MSKFYTSVERWGNNLLYRGYEHGKRFSKKVPFQPTLFSSVKQETGYTSLISKQNLLPKQFDNMREAKDYAEQYKGVYGMETCGTTNFITQFIQEEYPGEVKFDMDAINVVSFDIEVDISDGYADIETADKMITSIAYKSSKSDTYHLLGMKDYDKSQTLLDIDPDDIQFMKFDTEEALLKRFMQIWINDYPDVITGWNVEYFDVQYIVTRIIRLFGEGVAKMLSPWKSINQKTREIFGKPASTYKISGMTVIDYMDAFKKFGYKYGPQESYKLDHISHVILGEKKLDYSEYGSLTALWEQNPQLYLDYNLKDTQLIVRMEEETGLLALVMTVAYGGGVNYSDAFGTVGIWDTKWTSFTELGEAAYLPGASNRMFRDVISGYTGSGEPIYTRETRYTVPGSSSNWMTPETVKYGTRPIKFQEGGITSLPQTEGQVDGNGDGMSDEVYGDIEDQQEVALSKDEFIVPADVVAGLGNGSSNAGASKLYEMMDRVRMARTGKKAQPPEIEAEEFMPA